VGGTTLTTTGPGGSWSSEKVWNWGKQSSGKYLGSSGGVSSYYTPLPAWQSGISMTANGGSTSYRNIPDVALTGDNVTVYYNAGSIGLVGGTSCAAPLWAAFASLVNQQAVSLGGGTIGFVNPAIYTIGKGTSYGSTFHDITTGNNYWNSGSSRHPTTNGYSATTGYDLCTGWGTPNGQGLINALAGTPNYLSASPSSGFSSVGPVGGPFTITSQIEVLTNIGGTSVTWSLYNTSTWLNVSITNGVLASHATTNFSVTLANSASSLPPGAYAATLLLSNQNVGTISIPFSLNVGQSQLQNGGFETGDFTGWTLVGDTSVGKTVYDGVEGTSSGFTVVHSGSYGAFLGDNQPATLSQSISTVPGQLYLLSLWLDNPVSGSVQQFTLNWITNGLATNTLFSILDPPAFAWTNLQFLVSSAGNSATLQIIAENDPSYFGLDDVSLTPVPTPSFKALKSTQNNFTLTWVTTTNLVYQIQYATNLPATEWFNLTPSFVATNFSTTIVDTNALAGSTQRYYRLVVVP
jgi:hypothetical protein